MSHCVLVVPCFNEEQRLDQDALLSLLEDPEVALLLVDDGSSDGTLAVLRGLVESDPARISVLALPSNQGKAEAVRQGMLQALQDDAAILGYLDADLATPAHEILRLLRTLRQSRAKVLLASRIALLGRDVRRNAARHYLGRVFATLASTVLRTPVYDTQCGAKLFRRCESLEAALADPFLSRWVFDVELLGRMLTGTRIVPGLQATELAEEPLLRWHDVPNSKLGTLQMARALSDLALIERDLHRRRKQLR